MDDRIIDSEFSGDAPEISEKHAEKVSQVTENIIGGLEKFAKKTGVLKLGEPKFWTESAKALQEAARNGGAVDIFKSFWEIVASMPEDEDGEKVKSL